jgi:hypothetical protein
MEGDEVAKNAREVQDCEYAKMVDAEEKATYANATKVMQQPNE